MLLALVVARRHRGSRAPRARRRPLGAAARPPADGGGGGHRPDDRSDAPDRGGGRGRAEPARGERQRDARVARARGRGAAQSRRGRVARAPNAADEHPHERRAARARRTDADGRAPADAWPTSSPSWRSSPRSSAISSSSGATGREPEGSRTSASTWSSPGRSQRVRRRSPGASFVPRPQSDARPRGLPPASTAPSSTCSRTRSRGTARRADRGGRRERRASTVRDHGPGIADEDAERLFDRFYRAPAARGKPGSGLGLSIVRQVAETHGGRASRSAAGGGGARFRLVLPVEPRETLSAILSSGSGPSQPLRLSWGDENSNGRSVMRTRTSTLAAMLAVVLLGLASVASGCGSSSSEDGVAALEGTRARTRRRPPPTTAKPRERERPIGRRPLSHGPNACASTASTSRIPSSTARAAARSGSAAQGSTADDEKFRKAREECGMPFGRARPAPPLRGGAQEIQETMLEFAKCMREHGVDMPDPEFSGEGGRGVFRGRPGQAAGRPRRARPSEGGEGLPARSSRSCADRPGQTDRAGS